MGKVFSHELEILADTIEWANTVDLSPLEYFVHAVAGLPLVAIGSGGSATACHLVALLHRKKHQRPAFHTTPLDIILSPPGLHHTGIFFASASGNNKDVLKAFELCVDQESPVIGAVTLKKNSKLTYIANLYSRSQVLETEIPSGKDGYLATNTLIGTCIIAARAYGFDLSSLTFKEGFEVGESFCDRPMVHILFGGWAAPVATDLESKFNESALCSAQIADFRNFGHGRHLWLAIRGAETVVIALITPETSSIAEATLTQFPKAIPVVRLRTDFSGPEGTIDLMLKAFQLIEQVGRVRGRDPGRPRVPEFGRRLYRLSPPRVHIPSQSAVQRKQWASPMNGTSNFFNYEIAYNNFMKYAQKALIGAVILDYDGTMCTKKDRFEGIRKDIATECSRLLSAGIFIGIATGRGKSVRKDLQSALDQTLWRNVQIGYYNCTDIALLTDNLAPNRDSTLDEILDKAHLLLKDDSLLKEAVQITIRPHQLTLEPSGSIRTDALAAHVMACLSSLDGGGLRIVCSSHSLDVLGPHPGKLALVTEMRKKIDSKLEILCIGDRGMWPGNDYALLSQSISLSVDEISSLEGSCWNIAPSGVSGPDATLLYLRAISVCNSIGTFSWNVGTKR